MEAYCESDVKLLKAGCRKFREEFKQKADFDPMEKCVTIASACNRFWRKKMVPRNKIASQPPQGYGTRTNQSIKALKWLAWQEHLLRLQHPAPGDRIRTVRNGGEVCVFDRYLADGFDPCDPVTQQPTVYEFNGCLWHRCLRCFPRNRNRFPICHTDRTLQEVYEATLMKQEALRQRCVVKIMCECDWDLEVKTNPELQCFLDTLEMVEPLQPRNAFFGGRTNAVKLHHVAERRVGEKIKYIDVTSLYPWVNKTQEYPDGHPTVLVNPDLFRHSPLLRDGQSRQLTTTRTLSSRLTPQAQGQTQLPTMSSVHGRRDDETPLGKIVPLQTHTPATYAARRMVHPRNPESRGSGLHCDQDT